MELIQKIFLVVIIIMALFTVVTVTHSQTNESPCSSKEAEQFDFWLGSWKAEWKDSEGKSQYGRNLITKGFGNCVIEENFATDDGTFTGRSLSVYNARKKMWQQTWVDNTGAYMEFTGGKDGDNMYLQRKVTNKEGKEILQKMTFTDIQKNSFTWNWESSSDNGGTWTLNWQILYSRIK